MGLRAWAFDQTAKVQIITDKNGISHIRVGLSDVLCIRDGV